MNSIILTGRMTKDPVVSYSTSGTAVARFNLAVQRPKDKDGNEAADYPSCVAFGKTAEVVEKYTARGSKILVQGRIQTGSYEKNGQKVYTTDVMVDRVEFLDSKSDSPKKEEKPVQTKQEDMYADLVPDEDIPF